MNKRLTLQILPVCFFLLGVAFSTCTPSENNGEIAQVKYGTSFGECIGYCKHDLILQSGFATYHCSGWNETVQPITRTGILSVGVWDSLKTNLDTHYFFELPETLGCPDCADGGSEWIEIKLLNSETHKVTFEYNNEPDLLKKYIIKLRQMLGENKCIN